MKNYVPKSLILIAFIFQFQLAFGSTDTDRYLNFEAAEAEIYAEFEAIDEVVSFVEANENVTYSDLKSANIALDSLSEESALAFLSDEEEDSNRFFFTRPTAFLTGCVFGLPGILAVAIVNRDDNKTLNSSIWGCVASGCVSGGIVAIYYAYFITLFSSWGY